MTARAPFAFGRERVMYATGALYAIAFFALGCDRYIAHRSVEDLGIFVQSLATAGHGFTNTIEGQSHFAVHFSPTLYLFAPFLQFAHSPLLLVAVQAIAGALVAPPLFYMARKRAGDDVALGVAGVALLYPPLAGVTFTEFHENGLVPAATLWFLCALDARKWRAALALTFVTVGLKEDQSVIIAWLGTFAFIRARRTSDRDGERMALALIAIALAAIPLYFGLVRPLAGARGPWHPLVFLHVADPTADIGFTRAILDRLGYVALAFAPLLLLPFRSHLLILAVPGFAETLVSRAPVTYTMGQHYAAVWIPYVLLAFADATCAIAANRPHRTQRLLIACAALCATMYLIANPLHPKYFLRAYQPRDAHLDHFLTTLPPQLDVGTQEEIYTHLGFDRRATLGIECLPAYALFDFDYPDSNWVIRDGPLLKTLVTQHRYELMRADGAIKLFARIGPTGRAPGAPPPSNPYEFSPC
ncbi:MAG: DUF2079 domain-containing protein [Candidatus Eremiobacteraeota bacterium]|nr:DUF2079 domain-containing protein [Candidatus Eremiobacteraeota bacterium]